MNFFLRLAIAAALIVCALLSSARAQSLGDDLWQPRPGSPLEQQLFRLAVEQRNWLEQVRLDYMDRERVLLEIARRDVWSAFARRLGSIRRSSERIDLMVCAFTGENQDRCFDDGVPAIIRSGNTFCQSDGPCWTFWGYTIQCGVLFGVFEAANDAARPMARARDATREEARR